MTLLELCLIASFLVMIVTLIISTISYVKDTRAERKLQKVKKEHYEKLMAWIDRVQKSDDSRILKALEEKIPELIYGETIDGQDVVLVYDVLRFIKEEQDKCD